MKRLKMPVGKLLIKWLIRTIYFGLIIVAILGPSFGESKREIKTIGKDIMVCVDLSQSMDATDVVPSRVEKVKFELKNLLKTFNSDRIGIIIFSSEAYMQCPLTYDKNALNLFVQALNTRLVPRFGTDFAPALKLAMEKLTEDENESNQSKSKIVILISDGEDFGDESESIAKKLNKEDVRLFTLGIGTKEGSKIPTRGGFKTNNSGQEVVSKLETKSLKKLASISNGKYFEINQSRNDIARLVNKIRGIEGEMRGAKRVDTSQNNYFYFLWIALFFILLDIFISIRLIKL